MPLLRIGLLTIIVIAFFTIPYVVSGDDIVFLKPNSTTRSTTRVSGTIIDYTGRELLIRTVGSREQSIPTDRVEDIATKYTEKHAAADRLFEEHRYADAEAMYRRSITDEPRQWVRRMILSQVVWCLRNQDQYEQAAVTFALIVQNDPTTQYFDAIPLLWWSTELPLSAERRATDWLRDESDPVMQLVAASWLLRGPAELRGEAQRTIEALTRSRDDRVAQLAVAQSWRSRLVIAQASEVARWQSIVQQFDPRLRAGGYFLIGQALARHRKLEEAALALMRVPVLYPRERELAAESLLAAADALEKNNNIDESRVALRELLRDHAGSNAAAAAKSKLQRNTTGG